jgi:hypothetical protein
VSEQTYYIVVEADMPHVLLMSLAQDKADMEDLMMYIHCNNTKKREEGVEVSPTSHSLQL